MPRKPTPDGRRVHVNVRLSEPEAAAIDAVRGDLERGPWMRQAALSAAKGNSGIPGRITAAAGPLPAGPALAASGTFSALNEDEAHAGLAAAEPAPAAEKSRKTRAKDKCEHRIPPGSFCMRCDRLI